MNLRYTTLLTLLCWLLAPLWVGAQGVTTANIGGRILDASREPLIGATVVAVHEPTGTVYGNATDLDGYYRLANMRVGGPYTITVSYTGYGSQEFGGIQLRLGENRTFDATLQDNTSELTEVVVSARGGSSGENAGTSTQISTADIEALPTLNRDLNDFLRVTPQASTSGESTSFAGTNNRYNAIYIDGAVNNDVFGLAGSGTNGGQTGATPFSIDIIDQIQVVISPYDVSYGGFVGGGVNAVTKSGTNKFQGTAYTFYQDENLAGKTNQTLADRLTERLRVNNPGSPDTTFQRTRLDPSFQSTYGASFGGPILKDKVFFFVNTEFQNDRTPNPFEFQQYRGAVTEAQVNQLKDKLIDDYGYDPGTFGSVNDELKGVKIFAKLNFNLNESNQLVLRHNYNKAESFGRNAGNSGTINFSNNGVYFPSVTNSSALELNTTFGTGASNNLIVGYTHVNDDRDPLGQDFPNVRINDGRNSIRFGGEAFSAGNALEQSVFTLTDNFKLYRGKQTFTFGTHNEFYSIYNLFVPNAFGSYIYNNIDSFLQDGQFAEYQNTYSLLDDVAGDGSAAAADFNAFQLGFYAQDEINLNNNLTLTAGVRLDIPFIPTAPLEVPGFNDTILPKLAAQYPVAAGARSGQTPSGALLVSPRLGFNYDFKNDSRTVLRGGLGVFTSRIPFVWPGAQYTNNGVILGNIDERNIPAANRLFRPDPQNQYRREGNTPQGGQIDLFTEDFKYPQIFRTNLAVDHVLPGGIVATFEGLFSKTLNNILVTNINSESAPTGTLGGGPDDRPVYSRRRIDNSVGGDVYVVSNTNKGYTYTLTAQVSKDFENGLTSMVAYTYGDAQSFNDGTSSQNSSQWRGQVNVAGRNNPVFGRSDYATGHRAIASLNYRANWGGSDLFATTFSAFYVGETGNAYSYVIGGRPASNLNNESGSTSRNRSLIYIPASQSEINLVDIKNSAGVVTLSANEQWENLNRFIEDDPYLSENRGGYAEKNSNFLPFRSQIDVAIRQNIGFNAAGTAQRLQVSFDVFNFGNLLNSKWGVRYNVPGDFNNYELYTLTGGNPDTPRYNYTGTGTGKEELNISTFGSLWRARVGLRYIFN